MFIDLLLVCIKARDARGGTNLAASTRYNIFNVPSSLLLRPGIDSPISANDQRCRPKHRLEDLKEKVMVRIHILRVSIALAVILAGKAPESRGAEGSSVEQIVAEAQVALRHRHYSQANRTLQDALARFPGNAQLRLELGRVYVYQRQDAPAKEIFRSILQDDPSNREAKLELARVLSYDKQYEQANKLFREMLAANPDDEAAAIGLVQNLLFEKKKDDARREVEQALARHPNSLRLQEYRDDLLKNQSPLPAASHEGNALNRLQADANYFSDTAGNRAARAGQRFDLQLGRNFTNTFRLDV
jgi:tetratricopeptide (TPR) repeat protein